MKILHVIPAVAPRYGGPSQAIFEMCRALDAKDCQTLIATTDANGHRRLPVELNRVKPYQGVNTIFFRRQWSEAFKLSLSLSRWLHKEIRNFDVVHIHAVFSHSCLAAARACRKDRVPYIVRPLGTLDPWSLSQKPLKKKMFLRFVGMRMLKNAAAVHYTTADEQKLAESCIGPTNGVVIPLGVEVRDEYDDGNTHAAENPIYLDGRPYVLVMSRLHQKKGLELLIPAFLSLSRQQQFSGWRLVLAGDGDPAYVSHLKKLIARNDNGNVVFAGWLGGPEKDAALAHASILALPSYQENFGLSVVEAMARGVPVLVSPHVNLAAEIEQAGAGWVANLEALQPALGKALGDDMERVRRGTAAKALADRYSWPQVAQQLLTLYKSVPGAVAPGCSPRVATGCSPGSGSAQSVPRAVATGTDLT